MNQKSLNTMSNEVTSVQAEPRIYQIVGGKESLEVNSDAIAILKDIGLTFIDIEKTATPVPGYSYGVGLLPPSSVPGTRATKSIFMYGEDPLVFRPLVEAEEFVSNILFDVDTDKLKGLGDKLAIGNFSLALDKSGSIFNRTLLDTTTTNLVVFDVVLPGPPNIDLDSKIWELSGLKMLLSEEFDDLLKASGATKSVAGLNFADARTDRILADITDDYPLEEVTVPEL